MKDPAYCYTIVDVPGDLCCLAAHLTKWLSEVESCKVIGFVVINPKALSLFQMKTIININDIIYL